MKNGKRIVSITVKNVPDGYPGTSYLGEYSNQSTSPYSIDRKHSEDCQSVTSSDGIEQLERILQYIFKQRATLTNATEDVPVFAALDDAADILSDLQDELTECDCNGGDMRRHEYRYFNPSQNYGGCTPAEIRKYVKQDYARMESLNRGDWQYIGIAARAEIVVGMVSQTIRSSGLWGIESDSDQSYIKDVEQEQLDELRDQLIALGFSRRAIATAMKSVLRITE
jgi:hypothetical protein